MVVISLYESGSKGKSLTLERVIRELIDEGSLYSDFNSVQAGGDVRCYLETSDGKKVGVTTAGDDGNVQKEYLGFVSSVGAVDAWITATRTKGYSVEEVWKSSLGINEVYWVPKTVCDYTYKQEKGKRDNLAKAEPEEIIRKDQDVCNLLDSKRIVRLLKAMI